MSTTVDISKMLADFKRLYLQKSMALTDLIGQYYVPSTTELYFGNGGFGRLSKTNDKEVSKAIFELERILQKYQKAWTPISTLNGEGVNYKLAHLKVDIEINPDEVFEDYVSFLEGLETNDRTKWPFVRWFLRNHVLPRMDEDFELNEVFSGVDGVVIPGTANAAGQNFNGFGTQMATWITGGDVIAQATGIPNADAEAWYGQVKAWLALQKATSVKNEHIINKKVDFLFMSPELRDRLVEGINLTFNKNYEQYAGIDLNKPDQNRLVLFPGTRIRIVGLDSMIGSNRIFMTPVANRWGKNRVIQRKSMFDVKNAANPREVAIYGDFWKGVGFWLPQLLYVNDQP